MDILPEPDLPDASELISHGRELAQAWQVQSGAFLKHHGVSCEAEYKGEKATAGTLMQHAQIGWRDLAKSRDAWAEIHDQCAARNVNIDRYGICLDWSMGIPRDDRGDAMRGTGLILDGPEDFTRLTNAAPVAPHFGDFVLGFPASVENTCAALVAGSTSIGNLGQYFTFRLQNHSDDVTCTTTTLTALALIAAQPVPVLVHSNLDDGFAALFGDLSSSLGAVLLERHIGKLIGAEISHCWGHHFSDPVRRLAFHLALADVSDTPGTMIYGNTTSYRGSRSENFASLSSYLSIDITGQLLKPTGHAINPVPVTENERIPDVSEVIEAQLFAARLGDHEARHMPLLDTGPARTLADRIVSGGKAFFTNALTCLTAAGVDTDNPFEMLLAIRRLGGRRLETLCATGSDKIPSDIAEEVAEMAQIHLSRVPDHDRRALAGLRPRILTATTDVHEHGKLVLDNVLATAGATLIDGGTSVEPQVLAATALAEHADAIALSTYNGVAMNYYNALRKHLGNQLPVLIGGRLNQVLDSSNTSLPVDVGDRLAASGALVCREIEEAVPALLAALKETT